MNIASVYYHSIEFDLRLVLSFRKSLEILALISFDTHCKQRQHLISGILVTKFKNLFTWNMPVSDKNCMYIYLSLSYILFYFFFLSGNIQTYVNINIKEATKKRFNKNYSGHARVLCISVYNHFDRLKIFFNIGNFKSI